jgi:hypothetical protein
MVHRFSKRYTQYSVADPIICCTEIVGPIQFRKTLLRRRFRIVETKEIIQYKQLQCCKNPCNLTFLMDIFYTYHISSSLFRSGPGAGFGSGRFRRLDPDPDKIRPDHCLPVTRIIFLKIRLACCSY